MILLRLNDQSVKLRKQHVLQLVKSVFFKWKLYVFNHPFFHPFSAFLSLVGTTSRILTLYPSPLLSSPLLSSPLLSSPLLSSPLALALALALLSSPLLQQRRQRKPELSDLELEQQMKNDSVLATAQRLQDEQHDAVKKMNSMVLYAKCMAERDRQIKENDKKKKETWKANREFEHQLGQETNSMFEQHDARLRQRKIEQQRGKEMIIQQMTEREQQRLRERSRRELEAQQSVADMQRLAEEERALRQQKRLQGKQLLDEVMAANVAQARAKAERKRKEMDEDRQIAEYLKAKQKREEEVEQEMRRRAAEKELEIAALRAKQEKALDHNAAIDELRARRYQEELERTWRRKAATKEAEKQARIRDMEAARQSQLADKHARLAEQAYLEREEYERSVQWQQEQEQLEKDNARYLRETRKLHCTGLLEQITHHEKQRVDERNKFIEDGRRLVMQDRTEQLRLQKIKQQKLDELAAAGVPERYRAELMRMKL
jgi:cilia- and flagella-associated protein 45